VVLRENRQWFKRRLLVAARYAPVTRRPFPLCAARNAKIGHARERVGHSVFDAGEVQPSSRSGAAGVDDVASVGLHRATERFLPCRQRLAVVTGINEEETAIRGMRFADKPPGTIRGE
jgi:hypothetical protein